MSTARRPRSAREQAAYDAGKADAMAELGDVKPLSREVIRGMSQQDILDNWPRVSQSLEAGLPSAEDLGEEL